MKCTDVHVQKIDPSKPDTVPKFIDKLQIPEVSKLADWNVDIISFFIK
jgi:hypothetical protein